MVCQKPVVTKLIPPSIPGVRLTLTLNPMPGPGNGGPREWGAGAYISTAVTNSRAMQSVAQVKWIALGKNVWLNITGGIVHL